jgi:hypothetical protein
VWPGGLSKLKKNSPHRVSNSQPSGLYLTSVPSTLVTACHQVPVPRSRVGIAVVQLLQVGTQMGTEGPVYGGGVKTAFQILADLLESPGQE